MMIGDGDKGFYKCNGFDGGICFCFVVDYYLFDDISWISYYELGVNILVLFDWDNYYVEGVNNIICCMLYIGLKSDIWGMLIYGQQNSIYYDVVGVKIDIWDYDMIGQVLGNGINGDYDGFYCLCNMLKYKKIVGDVDFYGFYLFEDSEYLLGNGLCYKCKGGGFVGVDYYIMKDLIWGIVWNYICVEMCDLLSVDSKIYDQNIVGIVLSWILDNWIFFFGGGWYQNFFIIKKIDVYNYFVGDVWGIEYFVGYKFLIN